MSPNASYSDFRADLDVIRAANRRRAMHAYKALLRTLTLDQLDAQEEKHRAAGLIELADAARAEADRRRAYPHPRKDQFP
jgi:hypothetical protein